MKIAIQGLGRMGLQISRKLSEGGHEVIAHNRSPEPIAKAVEYGALGTTSKQEVIAAFKGEQIVLWVMLPADIVDAQVDEWLAILPSNSIIIDGGNSNFRLTTILNEKVTVAKSHLIDIGTSGGVWGYENGFSMMVGSDNEEMFRMVEPALKTLAAPGGAYHRFGPSGSGHYVKMVHNAVEYGMMESLAEGYRMLKEGPYQKLDLAEAADVWQHKSVVASWLNELCSDALKESTDLKNVSGYVSESGEARWTLEVAKELGIPLQSIQAAFDVRLASQKGEVNFATKLLAAMRNKFGGHAIDGDR